MPPQKAESDGLDAIVEAMVYLFAESRRVTRTLAERHGLTGSQLVIIKHLEPVGQLSLSELSARIRAKNSTVTGIIDRMERDGLVVRRRSDEDRRVIYIELTKQGAAVAAKVGVEPRDLFRQLLEELPAKDAAELERIVTKLGKRVKAILEESPEYVESSVPLGAPRQSGTLSRGSK